MDSSLNNPLNADAQELLIDHSENLSYVNTNYNKLQEEIERVQELERMELDRSFQKRQEEIISMVPDEEFKKIFDYLETFYGPKYLEFEEIEALTLNEGQPTIYNLMNLVNIKNKLRISDEEIHKIKYDKLCEELQQYMGV